MKAGSRGRSDAVTRRPDRGWLNAKLVERACDRFFQSRGHVEPTAAQFARYHFGRMAGGRKSRTELAAEEIERG